MSVDGFVAQRDDSPAELFDWYWGGEVVVRTAQESMSFATDDASAEMLADLTSEVGALICGRRLFDQTDGWGDNHPVGAPVVVVTHRGAPPDAAERFPRTSFVGSVPDAVDRAKSIAGEQSVVIASASVIQQALAVGLVDEIAISQIPVIFGSGVRYFAEFDGEHIVLEDPVVIQGKRALHLRYRVRR